MDDSCELSTNPITFKHGHSTGYFWYPLPCSTTENIMRIILATPEVDLRLAIQLLLSEEPNVKIVGTASNLDGVLALIQTTPVDLVFLDWDLVDQPMNTLIEEIHVEQPKLDLIILVSRASQLSTPLEAGVQAYLLKGEPPDKLVRVYRQIAADKKQIIHSNSKLQEEDAS